MTCSCHGSARENLPVNRRLVRSSDPTLAAIADKALKEIEAYQVPLMSLGFRVLSGGAVSEAEVRVFVRNFAPSEAAHPPLALNEYTQLNAMAAPSARVRCVVQETGIEWRLASGALLRCWKRALILHVARRPR